MIMASEDDVYLVSGNREPDKYGRASSFVIGSKVYIKATSIELTNSKHLLTFNLGLLRTFVKWLGDVVSMPEENIGRTPKLVIDTGGLDRIVVIKGYIKGNDVDHAELLGRRLDKFCIYNNWVDDYVRLYAGYITNDNVIMAKQGEDDDDEGGWFYLPTGRSYINGKVRDWHIKWNEKNPKVLNVSIKFEAMYQIGGI